MAQMVTVRRQHNPQPRGRLLQNPKGGELTTADINDVLPPHEVQDEEKLAKLTHDMESRGWRGRPLMVIQSAGMLQALTGSHRFQAAVDAGLSEIPVIIIQDGAAEIVRESQGWDSSQGLAADAESVADDLDRAGYGSISRQIKKNPMIELRAPTAQEVQTVKDELKLAKVQASVRIEKGIKRSYGTMTIRPRGRAFFEMPELVNITGILTRYGFHVDNLDNLHVHRPGLHYLRKRNPIEGGFVGSLVEGMGSGAGMAISAGLLAPLVVDRAAKVFNKLGLIRKNPDDDAFVYSMARSISRRKVHPNKVRAWIRSSQKQVDVAEAKFGVDPDRVTRKAKHNIQLWTRSLELAKGFKR